MMIDSSKRIALYSRFDLTGRDDIQADLEFLQDYCDANGMRVVATCTDTGNADHGAQPSRRTLMAKAAQTPRPFDVILVSDVMRFANDMSQLLDLLHKLARHGVEFVSLGRCLNTATCLEMNYVNYRTHQPAVVSSQKAH